MRALARVLRAIESARVTPARAFLGFAGVGLGRAVLEIGLQDDLTRYAPLELTLALQHFTLFFVTAFLGGVLVLHLAGGAEVRSACALALLGAPSVVLAPLLDAARGFGGRYRYLAPADFLDNVATLFLRADAAGLLPAQNLAIAVACGLYCGVRTRRPARGVAGALAIYGWMALLSTPGLWLPFDPGRPLALGTLADTQAAMLGVYAVATAALACALAVRSAGAPGGSAWRHAASAVAAFGCGAWASGVPVVLRAGYAAHHDWAVLAAGAVATAAVTLLASGTRWQPRAAPVTAAAAALLLTGFAFTGHPQAPLILAGAALSLAALARLRPAAGGLRAGVAAAAGFTAGALLPVCRAGTDPRAGFLDFAAPEPLYLLAGVLLATAAGVAWERAKAAQLRASRAVLALMAVLLVAALVARVRSPADPLGAALERLLAAQNRDGSYVDFDFPEAGRGDAYVTAYVALALRDAADLGLEGAAEALAQARRFLLRRERPDATWSWNPTLAADADSTAASLEALGRSAAPLRRFRGDDGGYAAYVSAGVWGQSDPTLAARALFLLDDAGARRYLGEQVGSDGSWRSYWWEGRVFPTALVATALGAGAGTPGVAFLRAAQNPDGGWGPDPGSASDGFHTGAAVWALAVLAPGADAVERGLRWLAERAGDLPPSARMRAPRVASPWNAETAWPVRRDESGCFTDANAVRAWAAAQRRPR